MTSITTCDRIDRRKSSRGPQRGQTSGAYRGNLKTKGGTIMHGVTIAEVIEKFKLKNMTPDIDAEKIVLTHPDVNRPAL